MKTLKNWKFCEQTNNSVVLTVDEQHEFTLFILENNLFKVLLKKKGTLQLNKTWSIAVDGKTPWAGRDRISCAGFSQPDYQLEQGDETLTITTSKMRVIVHQPLWLEWQYRNNAGEWAMLARDRHTGAYQINPYGDGIAHYQRREEQERYYGLGEKAGDLNRKGKRFEMRNLDAMGYNAATTDPLYKHIPFLISHTDQISYGLFYDNLSISWFDLGNELDNYHLPYRRYQAEAGDLDYYIFCQPRVLDVTKTFVRLTGKTLFPPKWSLGYSGSTMHYTDAEDAQNQLVKFIALCREHDIPCDSFQLSSGYTSIGTKRYVFNWNYSKVPEPEKLCDSFHQAGMRLAANIKPCLLHDHPLYQEVKELGLFIRDGETGQPEQSVFWDDVGSHLDFTNPQTIAWWKDNVTTQLLEYGIDSTWNDNNEYEIWDAQAQCAGFGSPIAIKHLRPVMPLLMMRASMEAQQEFAPEKRPYLISRSGCPGMQRYVQTWSGDNRTSWQTLRYNTRMGLGMSLSGLYNIGHDVGGFAGNRPDAELFVRWVQNGVMHPRFTIHSWHDDHSVNEPWMYPAVLPIIRDAIELRYRLMPYIYTLLWQAHHDDEPILRPTFLDNPHDPQTYHENDDFMLGRDLLVASVVEAGQRQRSVYLPDNHSGWYDFYTGKWFSGGQHIVLDAPLERLPLLVRAGAMLTLSSRVAHVDAAQDNQRSCLLFPAKACSHEQGMLFDDDGESTAWQQGHGLWLSWSIDTTPEYINVTLRRRGSYQPAWQQLEWVLPAGEQRIMYINGQVDHCVTLREVPYQA